MANKSNCTSIDIFRNQVYSTMYSIITVLGLLGNGFALVVLLLTYKKSSPFQVYMLNLVVSDLLCICALPLRVIYYANQGEWGLGDFLCRISSYAFYVNLYCSILFMATMSVSRFLAIVFPVQNMGLVTECRARLACVAIWVFVCTASSPFLMSGQYKDARTNKTKCFEPRNSARSKLRALSYFSLVVGFLLPFLVILVCSAGIIRTLVLRKAAGGAGSRGRGGEAGTRAIRMIIIIMATFLVSFTPYHVQRSVHLDTMWNENCENFTQKLVVVTLCLATSNCCFDPLLYFFSGEGFCHRMSTIRGSMRQTAPARPGQDRRGQKMSGCHELRLMTGG
ncbi:hypothetical protein NHX12_011547 [Muraenolepis orangiensis]|uniref:G-protein coupled receptors family 1 profile domain-containing protein n=1 Tax=Muraenolepis orangiensis TaxID=630683 RepID=A0A9Q0I5T7_9TELE|nr:hypothetical protein NHX12_011547 [Muraenolepis orangiensis]